MSDDTTKTTSMARDGGEDDGKGPEMKRKAGRPKKGVKTSPAKVSPNDNPDLYCKCGIYISKEISIECDSCGQFWHLCCVGLKGLTEEMVNCLESWDCPNCFVCLYSDKFMKGTSAAAVSPDITPNCGTIKIMLQEELHKIQPVIKATVADAVRKSLPESVCSKEDVKSVVKSYSEVTQQSLKKVTEEAAIVQSSKTVVENVVRKLDADKIEREKRINNVVVYKVPESKMVTSGQKNKDDMDFIRDTLKMKSNEISRCWRVGKLDESKTDQCRPLIIELIDTNAVEDWTKGGRGLQTESGHWINKDLCAADWRANFLMREERRKRMEG